MGFNTITNLSPLTIPSSTGESPQSKVWAYAGKHWTVLTNSTDGTSVYRLDGNTWTFVLNLASGTSAKADCKVVGNVTHIFIYKGTGSYLFSVEYDPATNKYKKWTVRTTRTDVTLETGVKTATIDIDATGRMWLASDGTSTVNVRWSDAPYSSFSAPVIIATGTASSDISGLVAMPSINKVGILWSNKNSKRFGFTTHSDGSDPAVWSTDEAPGASSALNIGLGLSDNQFNLKATQNGTVFATVKTNYNTAGYPQVQLLVRRPDGTWDAPYPVTVNEGTYPLVILSESLNKLKVIYSLSNGTVSYKESPISSINFSLPFTLISGAFISATSTKASYASEVVILASSGTSGAGVLGIDYTTPPDQTPPTVLNINRQSPSTDPTNATSVTYRTTFSETVTGVDVSDFVLTVASGSLTGSVSSVTPVSGTVYDVTISPISGSGTVRLDLKSSNTGITDVAGNAISGGFTSGQTFSINQGIPTFTSVSIASNNNTPSLAKPGDVVNLSFTASEAINIPAVSIATNVITATAAGGNSYTASYTMVIGDVAGTIPFTIDFSNTVGTAGTQVTATTNGTGVNFDKTTPSVVNINRQSPATNPTNATSVTFRPTFSEPVNGVDITDFSLIASGTAIGTISSVTPISSTVYDIIITSVGGNGTLRLDLNSSGATITDIAGNSIAGSFTGGQAFTIQQGIPTLTSVSIASGNNTPSLAKPGDLVSLIFTASDPINAPVVTIATHQVSATAGTGNSFVASYTMIIGDAMGNVPFTIDFSSTAGVPGLQVTTTTNGSTVNYDKTPPTITSINRQSSTDPTSATSVVYRATFSEAVTGVDPSDFLLTATSGSLSGTVASVTPINGSTYDIIASVNGTGTLRLDLNSSNTGIIDVAVNAISGGFTSGQTFTINQGVPTLTTVSITSGNTIASLAKPGDVISLNFTASEPVNTPVVAIAANAVSSTANGGNSFTATYIMTLNDVSGVVPFSINFSNIVGTAGSQVTATTNGTIVNFDKTIPTIISINLQSPATSSTNATSVTFRATFSEQVTGLDVTDFALTTTGSATGTISNVASVSAGLFDITLTSVYGNGTVRLDLKASGTGVTDAAGNAISGGFTTGQTYTINQVPIVLSINRQSPAGLSTSAEAATYRVIFSVPVNGVDATDFIATTVSGNVRGTLAYLALPTIGTAGTESVQAVNGSTYDVTVRAVSGNGTLRLDVKNGITGIVDAATGAAFFGGFTSGQTYNVNSVTGFATFSDIASFPITTHTADQAQAKLWNYAGKWWAVLSIATGTKIFRLDGNTWKETLDIYSGTNSKADCIVVGNVTHILLFRASTTYLVSVEYDAATNAYKLWSQRPAKVGFNLGSTVGTACITMDDNGRMWLANDGTSTIGVRYSDAPYSSWSSGFTLVNGITNDDICSLITLPGKIGIMWGDQNTKRFGFRTHTNGATPTTWSADEAPGAQTALNLGYGLADNHISLTRASDGTLYAAIKTGYDVQGQITLGVLVRNPSGVWSDPYPVTSSEGTRPFILLNEAAGRLKVIYTSKENGGDILYRESSASSISFGSPHTLIGGNPSLLFNYISSTHQTYNSEIAILATDITGGSSALQAVSIIASESAGSGSKIARSAPATNVFKLEGDGNAKDAIAAYPNPFKNNAVLSFSVAEESDYTVTLYNNIGAKLTVVSRGKAMSGKLNTISIDGSRLVQGIYLVQLRTKTGTKTIKLLRTR